MSGNTPEWLMRASVGDMVVCIRNDTAPWGDVTPAQRPDVGEKYRIREILISPADDRAPGVGAIRVHEITLPTALGYDSEEAAFWAGWFRPADTTDLPESLTEILTRTNPVQWKEAENV